VLTTPGLLARNAANLFVELLGLFATDQLRRIFMEALAPLALERLALARAK
jgi:hypothetical protein